ncbi:MAG: hypothetical protein D6760_13525 [Deltaproteobacteria bacterium]|nr:MAG: hypothetical protein D6760_13525 [Deltaproteobacteria bacterium]
MRIRWTKPPLGMGKRPGLVEDVDSSIAQNYVPTWVERGWCEIIAEEKIADDPAPEKDEAPPRTRTRAYRRAPKTG